MRTDWLAALSAHEDQVVGKADWEDYLDRLAVSGTLVPCRPRRRYGRSALGLIGIGIAVLGIAALLYGVWV